jgi:hypothetical protein
VSNYHLNIDTKTTQSTLEKRKYRVMLVDDEQDITAVFKIGLERNEFIVTTYNDPSLALLNYRPGSYDL